MYTHFVYTVPHIARAAFFKGISIPNIVRGTVYTHFVYTYFKGFSIPNTVPHIARVEQLILKDFLYLIQLEERCTHILYTPFLI